MYTKIKDEFIFLPKSKIKAGQGLQEGKYPFYTSSDSKTLYLNEYAYEDEAVIIGTGGKPSCNYATNKFSYSTDNFALKSNGKFATKFLYYFLRFNNLYILDNGFHGSGLKHISRDYVENIDIPVYDLNEQLKIVSVLDDLNTLLDLKLSQLKSLKDIIKSRFIGQEASYVTKHFI